MKYSVSFILQDPDTMETALSYAINIAEVAGKRVTLSYVPATTTDEQVVNNYGGIFNVPAYLVNVKPQIKIEGIVAVSGSALGLGTEQAFNMQFVGPTYGTENVINAVTAGAYYGLGINPSKITKELLEQRRSKIAATQNWTNSDTIYSDDYIGELLYTSAMVYFFELNTFENIAARSRGVVNMKDVSAAIVSADVAVSNLLSRPMKIAAAGMMIDVDRNIHIASSKNGDQAKIREFMVPAGQLSSALEHGIFEQLYRAKGVSTMQVLQLANSQGIPIYTITQENVSSVLPRIQAASEVITDIQNAINAGKQVVIPQQNVSYYGWTGTGYVVLDPTTGAGGYMISTSLAGGGQCITAGGGAHQCLLYVEQFWHMLDNIVAIVAGPTLVVAALVLTYTEIGLAGLALVAGLSLLTILIGAIIALTVIYLIKLFIESNTAANVNRKRLYIAERGMVWIS